MSWNQTHAPLLIESFPKTPRTQSEASQFYGSHNYKTKQTTFLHNRLYHFLLASLGDDNWPFDLGVGSFCLQIQLVENKEEEDWFFCGWIL
jgi:hypothetical protein